MMTGLTSVITSMNRKELKVIPTIYFILARDLLTGGKIQDKKIVVTASTIASKSTSNIDHSFDLLHFTPHAVKRIANFTQDKLSALKEYVIDAILKAINNSLKGTWRPAQQIHNCTLRPCLRTINTSSYAPITHVMNDVANVALWLRSVTFNTCHANTTDLLGPRQVR